MTRHIFAVTNVAIQRPRDINAKRSDHFVYLYSNIIDQSLPFLPLQTVFHDKIFIILSDSCIVLIHGGCTETLKFYLTFISIFRCFEMNSA